MSDEQHISICSDDCRRWSADINERLDAIRTKDGEDVYKLMFTCAFLLLGFAEQLDAGQARLSRPADAKLH